MKKIIILLLVLVFLVSCSSPAELHVSALKGPTSMGLVETKVAETMDILGSPDEIVGKVTSGEADVAMVPMNMASILYNKLEGKIRLLAVTTEGNLYLMGEPINSMDELEGKTIISAGQGATPMYVLELLTEGIDVSIEYLPNHSDVAAAASENKADYYVLPEPFVTVYKSKVENPQLAYDLAKAYKEKTGHSLTMGAVITTQEKLDEKKKEIHAFLEDYQASVEKVLADPAAAAQLVEKYGILEKAALAEKAIPGAGIVYRSPAESKEAIEAFFALLMEKNPKALGGKLPGDDFYYEGN